MVKKIEGVAANLDADSVIHVHMDQNEATRLIEGDELDDETFHDLVQEQVTQLMADRKVKYILIQLIKSPDEPEEDEHDEVDEEDKRATAPRSAATSSRGGRGPTPYSRKK